MDTLRISGYLPQSWGRYNSALAKHFWRGRALEHFGTNDMLSCGHNFVPLKVLWTVLIAVRAHPARRADKKLASE